MRRFLQKKCEPLDLDKGGLKPAPDCGLRGRKRSGAFALELEGNDSYRGKRKAARQYH
jgi:hypothetical protein